MTPFSSTRGTDRNATNESVVLQSDRRRRKMITTIPEEEEDDSPTTCVAPVKRRPSSRGPIAPGQPQRKDSTGSSKDDTHHTSSTAASSSASTSASTSSGTGTGTGTVSGKPSALRRSSSTGSGSISRRRSTNSNSSSGSSNHSASSRGGGRGIPIDKSVHWYNKVQKKRHIRVEDMTDEEKEAVWYTENDSKIILGMAKVTVRMMMKGECPTDDVDYCSRGLEGKTPAGARRRQENKFRCRSALLQEQEMQREEGVFDPDYLAQVSREHSKDVCIQARHAALSDEQAVREYLNIDMPPSASIGKLKKDIVPTIPSRFRPNRR